MTGPDDDTADAEEGSGDGDTQYWCTLDFDDGESKDVSGAFYSIGRNTSNTRSTDNPAVSRNHCTLTYSKELSCVVLEDTSSKGTFVNGSRVHRRTKALEWGDKVEIVKGNKVCWNMSRRDQCNKSCSHGVHSGVEVSLRSDSPVSTESVLHGARCNGRGLAPSDPRRK